MILQKKYYKKVIYKKEEKVRGEKRKEGRWKKETIIHSKKEQS